MPRLIPALLLIVVTQLSWSQKVNVKFADRATVENRLRESPRSNRAREDVLREHFEEVGCKGEALSEQAVGRSKNPNLICTLPGELDRVIVVGAHFDFVDAGQGIIDNWSGASLLPLLYAGARNYPVRHRFVFVSFTDEEKGLVGSSYYVHELTKSELAKISAMINMDSLGTSPTKVEVLRGDKRLLTALSVSANTLKLPIAPMDVHDVGRSDSDSFEDKHVPTVCLHSMTQQTIGYLHSPEDRVGHVDFAAYYDSYRLIALYLAYLDQVLDAAPSSPTSAP